jgi:WD40 repeat protein
VRLALSFLLACAAFAASGDAPANPVTAVAFHPVSGQLVSGGYGEVLVWDAAHGKLDRRIAGLVGRVRGLAFSKDGSKLVVAEGVPARSGAVRLLDFATGNVRFTLDQEKDECFAVAFSPDSKLIAAGAPDGTVRLWNADDGKLVTTLKEQTGWITAVAFSPNGKLLAASSADRSAQVWLTDGWKPLTRIPDNPTAPVNSVAFSPDNTMLILALGGPDDAERAVRIWRTDNAKQLKQTRPIDVGPGIPQGLAFSAPGVGSKQPRLLVALSDKTIKVLNQNGGLLSTFVGDTDWVDAIAVNADGSLIASGSASGAVLVWNGTSGKLVATLK